MEEDFLKRKITLFLCKKWQCWIKPERCIDRQREEVEQKSREEVIKEKNFDLSYCKTCEQGNAMKQLKETYFKFATVERRKNGKR